MVYADDMRLISDSTDKPEEMLQGQDESFNEMGLTIIHGRQRS